MSLIKEQINEQTPPGVACSPPFNLLLVPLYYYFFQTTSLHGSPSGVPKTSFGRISLFAFCRIVFTYTAQPLGTKKGAIGPVFCRIGRADQARHARISHRSRHNAGVLTSQQSSSLASRLSMCYSRLDRHVFKLPALNLNKINLQV